MARTGDPCTTCGRREPYTKFTEIRGKNRGSRRQHPVWYRPQQCDSCRRPKGTKKSQTLTVSKRWAQNARKRGLWICAPCDFTMEDWQRAVAYFDHKCAYCRKKRRLTQDHVQPVVQGGGHTATNIVPACGPCNSLKRSKPLEVFADPATVERIQTFLVSLREADERAS